MQTGRRDLSNIIYKLCEAPLWREAERTGVFEGGAVDVRDGFIHFSSAEQLAETAAKHFAGVGNLLLVAVDVRQLGDALRWEVSRGGALFPHLYGELPLAAALWTAPLPDGADRPRVLAELAR